MCEITYIHNLEKLAFFCCVLELITRPKVMERFVVFLKCLQSFFFFCNWIMAWVAKLVFLFISFNLFGFPSFFLSNSYLFSVEWFFLYNIGLIGHISTGISIGVRVSPRSWIFLPHPTHSHHSRLSESPSLSSLSQTAISHWLSSYQGWCSYIHAGLPIHVLVSCVTLSLIYLEMT